MICEDVRYAGCPVQIIFRRKLQLAFIVTLESRGILAWNKLVTSKSVALRETSRAIRERLYSGSALSVKVISVCTLIICSVRGGLRKVGKQLLDSCQAGVRIMLPGGFH